MGMVTLTPSAYPMDTDGVAPGTTGGLRPGTALLVDAAARVDIVVREGVAAKAGSCKFRERTGGQVHTVPI